MPIVHGFTRSLDVRLLEDGRWELLEDLRYLSALTGKAYTVDKGFRTDMASVPRIPIAYYLTGNTARLAAIIHDFLYSTGAEPRETADDIFAEIMDATGEPGWRRGLMWAGVRVFGASHYIDRDGKATAGFAVERAGD